MSTQRIGWGMAAEALLVLALVPASGAQQGQEQPRPIDPSSRRTVDTLRTIARTIRACPETLEGETNWGKKTLEILRVYLSAPLMSFGT
jgi:hypothetical protein